MLAANQTKCLPYARSVLSRKTTSNVSNGALYASQ